MNIVYNMDCMEAMRKMKDKEFDLCVCDPPYGIDQGGEKNKTRGKLAVSKSYHSFCDDNAPNERYFQQLMRVSKNQIIFGANHFISKIPLDSSCWIVWDKDNGRTDFADCELAWTSFKTAVRIFRYRWQGMLQQDMKNKEYRIHPTQKPIALYDWIFSKYAKKGDRILDTHLGSGSSRIAAHKAGLDFVGYEIDKEYFDKAEERFQKHTAQMGLWDFGM